MARKDVDMTQGNILKHYINFAAPLLLGLLFQQLYNAVDTMVVGQFVGETALAAVGSTGTIVNMLIGIFNGLSLGSGVVLSQAYGAKNEERIRVVVHTTITATLYLCVFATVAGLLITKPSLRLMNTDPAVFDEAAAYLTTYFAGISGLLVYNMGSAILRAVGDSRRPLYFLIFSAVVNTVLDLLFVIGFEMGVFGVALATVIAQGVSAVLVLIVLTREKNVYGLRWREMRMDRTELGRIFRIGLPSSVQQGLTSFSNVFVMRYINAFGAACTAGWAAYSKLDMFLMVPVMALAQASTTFVGQNWGAKRPERARQGVRYGVWMSLGCMAVLAAVLMIFARPLLHLITQEQAVLDFGERFVHIITPFYLCICFNQMYGGALRGIGDAATPTLIFLASFVGFRQVYLYLTNLWLGQNFLAVSLAYPMGWIVASSLLYVCYRCSKLFRTVLAEASA